MAVNITTSSAILIWDTSNNRDVTGYAVYRDSPRPEVWITNKDDQVTHHAVSSLTPGTRYCYRVLSYIDGNLYTTQSATHCFYTLQGKFNIVF